MTDKKTSSGGVLRLGWVLVFLAMQTVASGQEAERLSFVTRSGETIQDAKLVRVEPDGLSLQRAEGISKISFEFLPDDIRERFKMTQERAAKYRTRLVAAEDAHAEREKADSKGNYIWHPAGTEIAGRFVFARDGKVLIQERNPYFSVVCDIGIRMFLLADLPAVEQERVSRLSSHQTLEEKQIGEGLMKRHLQRLGQGK